MLAAVGHSNAARDDLGGGVGTDLLVGGDGLGELAGHERVIDLMHFAARHGLLHPTGGLLVARDHDDAAGLTVETGGEVDFVEVEEFAGRAGEAGPGAVLGWMAENMSGLVEGDQFGVLKENPTPQLIRKDKPTPVDTRHRIKTSHSP